MITIILFNLKKVNFIKLDCSSKHALLAYSDSVRGELFAHGNIQVMNAQPGYINTNVSINAITQNNEKNNVNDELHKKGYDPNHVDQIIIKGILEKSKEVMIHPWLPRLAIWLRFFWPNLFFWAMKLRAKKMFANNFQE